MSEKRGSTIERVLRRIERHVEEWREQEMARKDEVEAHREQLWAEAHQRQKLLTEAIAGEEAHKASLEEITKEHRIVYVLHREDLTGTLEDIAGTGDRLVNIIPGKGDYGGGRGIQGIKGSWLVFEQDRPEASPRDDGPAEPSADAGRA